MTTTPTPEEFLLLDQPEDDTEAYVGPGVVSPNGIVQTLQAWVHAPAPTDPLTSIATSLEALTGLVRRLDTEAAEAEQLRAEVAWLRKALESASGEISEQQALIDQVREIIKPSTSKLANSIRAVLDPEPEAEPVVEEAEAAPTTEELAEAQLEALSQGGAVGAGGVAELSQPAPDAPVEAWRAYARDLGYADVDNANRSQIRTLLGLPHFSPDAA